MVQPICKDVFFLSRASEAAGPEDLPIGEDLVHTLLAHREGCVGMAANMIGKAKRIIVFFDEDKICLMFNPELVKTAEPYETEEGCLSLTGTRKTTRYRKIKVRYENEAFQIRLKSFEGWTAQIIQHEIDHCNGIVI